MMRGAVITASQFAIYDQSKYELARGLVRDGPANSVAASLIASVASGVASNPLDVAKSRLFTCSDVSKTASGRTRHGECIVKTAQQRVSCPLARARGNDIAPNATECNPLPHHGADDSVAEQLISFLYFFFHTILFSTCVHRNLNYFFPARRSAAASAAIRRS